MNLARSAASAASGWVRRTVTTVWAGDDSPRRVPTRYLALGILALSVLSLGGTILTPLLLAEPLLLIAATPRLPFLVLASEDTPLTVFLAVGTVRLLAGDPLHFLIGRRHGAPLISARLRAWTGRLGFVAVAVRPTSKVLLAAGASGVSFPAAAIADVTGTVVYLGLLAGVGAAVFS